MSEITYVPSSKVTTGILAGALAAIVAWAANKFLGEALPPGIEAAVATIISFVAAYLKPETRPSTPPEGE